MKCFIVNRANAEHPIKDDSGFICISNDCDLDYAKQIQSLLHCKSKIQAYGGTKDRPGSIYIICN